jgi:very-short-patch-repair endonuclease
VVKPTIVRRLEAEEDEEGEDGEDRFIEETWPPTVELDEEFSRWQAARTAWRTTEIPARRASALFDKIYGWHGILEREGEAYEIAVADGLLSYGTEYCHQVLRSRLELSFLPDKGRPAFELRYRDSAPELYVEMLRNLPSADAVQVRQCIDEQKANEWMPLALTTDGFFRRLIQGLYRDGVFVDKRDPDGAGSGVRAKAKIERRPMLLLQKRRTGASTVFQSVLDDLAAGKRACSPGLLQIIGLNAAGADAPVSLGTSEPRSRPALANEEADVLFAKPANAEQSQIAKRLDSRDAVLVQGPPGTGKTHTIANLVGHLLAQGKRVLITAQTSKALRVLRDKISEPLRPLCVSVLQNDKQSQDELQASVKDIHERLSRDVGDVEREVQRLTDERKGLLASVQKARGEMLDARQDEIRDVVFGGKSISPTAAAKLVKDGVGKHDWIPGPVKLGVIHPIYEGDLEVLYASNSIISPEDEQQLRSGRPPALKNFPSPDRFKEAIDELRALECAETKLRAELWEASADPDTLERFEEMLSAVHKTIDFLRDGEDWHYHAIQAGRDGEAATKIWSSLIAMIEQSWTEIQSCNERVMQHGPEVSDFGDIHETLRVIDEILAHHAAGKGFGAFAMMLHSDWFALGSRMTIAGRRLDISNKEHVLAVRALVRTKVLRDELRARWARQITNAGGPAPEKLSDCPEKVCRQFVPRIQYALEWHARVWSKTEAGFASIGFRWTQFLEMSPPALGEHADLKRLRYAVVNELAPILQSRRNKLRLDFLQKELESWRRLPVSTSHPIAQAALVLGQAIVEENPTNYAGAYQELERLSGLEDHLTRRHGLLEKVRLTAPGWAKAIERREGVHAGAFPPGPVAPAWEWRQIHDELERRAGTSLSEIQERIDAGTDNLMGVTAKLIEAKTWLHQMRRTTHEQRRALGAYAALRSKLTKSGTGVRDAEVRAAARDEMVIAKDAVPVWIMPLAEVATTFDAQRTRFDVVIVDESSQVDPSGLFAIYLGDKTVIVGDDEQVTPIAVGEKMDDVKKLITILLEGVPHSALYDGETSLYDLAQISFGGVIRLVEHFRCAPDIIAFSNSLSYNGTIRPLREAGAIPLKPHVVSHRVVGRETGTQVNAVEAEEIASLICAAVQDPAYSKNDEGKPTSFGVISLVGPYQSLLVDNILRQRLSAIQYRDHKILCGDPAQFQGDERDVVFLSVVDGPPDTPPLSMRQEGAKKAFKKRFNVAASRARNQMWVVHSLNHETDLQPGDYRRRIIEHAIDPGAWERDYLSKAQQVDSRSKVFEGGVLRHLMQRGYRVQPQYRMGAYSIDLMVLGQGGKRLAVECDGEAFHGPDQLQNDINRQAILERLGLKFERIRGSVYFRDEDRALKPVFDRLAALGIEPQGGPELKPEAEPEAKHLTIIREAEAIRARWAATPAVEVFSDTGKSPSRSSKKRGWGRRLADDQDETAASKPVRAVVPPTAAPTPVQQVLRGMVALSRDTDEELESAILAVVREKSEVGVGSLVAEINRRFNSDHSHAKVDGVIERLARRGVVQNAIGVVRYVKV